MPRGRGRGGSGHKGQRRHFSNPDQLEENKEKKERERRWRQQRGEISSDEEKSSEESSSSSEEEETAEDAEAKAKGVQHLIEVENPNRIVKKEKKVATLPDTTTTTTTEEAQPQLTRREREELEKQKAKVQYQKAHAAGKTAEAKADLARLAIIKQQREEAAKRRELEIQARKEAESAKAELTKKALGKKT